MDETLKKQLMSELGKNSAKSREEKLGPDYMRLPQVKGVGARQKKSGKFEMISHQSGSDTVEHKKDWNCGLPACTQKNKTVQKTKRSVVKTVKSNMLYKP